MIKLPESLNFVRRFRKNKDGNVGVLFAASAVTVIGTMGAAMDYSTLKIFVKNNDRPPESIQEGFTEGHHAASTLGYEFKGFVKGGASNVDVSVLYDDDAKEARVTVSGNTVPTFVQLLGKHELEFKAVSVVSYLDVDESHPASIALVLDNSGSMRWDSEQLTAAGTRPDNATSRIDGLKTSVRTFRDELKGRIGDQTTNPDGVRILRTGILQAAGGTNSNPPMAKAREWLNEEDNAHRLEAVRKSEEYRQPLKFAVFMTDGQNTTGDYEVIPGDTGRYYGQIDGRGDTWFVTTSSSTASFHRFTEGTLTLATDRQTIESCEAMKAEGTTIYTIGYALEVGQYYNPSNPNNPASVSIGTRDTANSLLAACASKPEFFISAGTGDELEGAFDQIQNSIVKELIRIKS